MTNDKINNCNRVREACAYEPDTIRFHVNGSSAGGIAPQSWTSTWHRARPGSSNNVTREYAWGLNMGGGIGGLLNVKQSGQNYSYLYDGKGNVSALIDSSETVAATYTYDAFGNLMVKTGSLDQPFQFSTKRFDSQTGLVYYGYRFYSPVQGRWITRDPLGEAGGMNLYGFVEGNPVNSVDPYGLLTVPFTNIWINAGECHGANAAKYWAQKQAETGNLLYSIPGALASLWTPDTSDTTFWTLVSAYSLKGWAAKTGPWAGRIAYHRAHAGGPHQYRHIQIMIRTGKHITRHLRIRLGL
jgi:RHS repeat-associated protein